MGLSADADVMELTVYRGGTQGVTREFGEKGHITKIEWMNKSLNGNLDKFKDLAKRMPRLQVLNLSDNRDLKGTMRRSVSRHRIISWLASGN